ncbi:hypothetical protein ACLB2K_027661 [Fragaria x ananassa]
MFNPAVHAGDSKLVVDCVNGVTKSYMDIGEILFMTSNTSIPFSLRNCQHYPDSEIWENALPFLASRAILDNRMAETNAQTELYFRPKRNIGNWKCSRIQRKNFKTFSSKRKCRKSLHHPGYGFTLIVKL